MPQLKNYIPEAEMAASDTGLSKADQAMRDFYDSALKANPAGQATVLELLPEDNSRAVFMRIRAASKRTGIPVNKLIRSGNEIQFSVGSNGAKTK